MNCKIELMNGHPGARSRILAVVLVVTGIIATSSQAWAQGKRSPKPPKKTFEDVTLTTRDGVFLRCSYYPGPEKKTTVPLILLHDWNGRRGELHALALFLQKQDHAIIVPDLRGHGNSVRQRGVQAAIDRDKMKPKAVELMRLDVEAAKAFLLERNNESKLNIEQLCVLGTGFGATLALDWAVLDWNVNNLPRYKQGQDVKGLILVSPLSSFKGLNLNKVLRDQRVLAQLSVLFIVGRENARRYSDIKRIEKAFRRAHSSGEDGALPFYAANTSLQGVPLIYARGYDVAGTIRIFIDRRLVRRAGLFPWTDRTNPYK